MSERNGCIREVKVTNKSLSAMKGSVQQLKGLTVKNGPAAWRLARVVAVIQGEIQRIDKRRDELIRQYGEPSPNGMGYQIVSSNKEVVKAFNAAYEEFINQEEVLRVIPIQAEALGDAEIPVAVLADLGQFFDFGDTFEVEKPVPAEA